MWSLKAILLDYYCLLLLNFHLVKLCVTVVYVLSWNLLEFLFTYVQYNMHYNIQHFPCNENQLDALFIISLFCQSTSTCFTYICSPSSGGILYIHNNLYVLCFLADCLLAGLRWNPANRQSTTVLCLRIQSHGFCLQCFVAFLSVNS